MPETVWLILLVVATSGLGVLGGLGGAILLVPILVLLGWPATEAAPFGLMSVAAGSIAAAPQQLRDRTVNHRLGITTEVAATTGAVSGAILSGLTSEDFLVYLLAGVALAAAFFGVRRSGVRNPAVEGYGADDVGERVGALDGAYPVSSGVAPYRVRRLPLGLTLMGLAGLVAGLTGTSGGFLKTPTASEVMHVPTKVAAATTTFTVGITASAALVVMAVFGRLEVQSSAAIIVGSLAGGVIGAWVQSWLSPVGVRRGLSVILVIIGVILAVSR
ncbi:MAG TPA: sulfite exporter TauE/SafE family protein [Acidimicrobiia bacterium]|nr:sulfite exporter TauE/SafE family protein [Acidimicrobiia bacterium]